MARHLVLMVWDVSHVGDSLHLWIVLDHGVRLVGQHAVLLLDRRLRREGSFLKICLGVSLATLAGGLLRTRAAGRRGGSFHLLSEARVTHPGSMAIGDLELVRNQIPVDLLIVCQRWQFLRKNGLENLPTSDPTA